MANRNFFFYAGIVVGLLLLFSCRHDDRLSVAGLTCNFREMPMGVDDSTLFLGWQIRSTERNVVQAGYQVIVAESPEDLKQGQGTFWDSEVILSDQSVFVKYPGPPPAPGKRYYWRVRIWDPEGNVSPWSDISWWHTGLFTELDWAGAQWIALEEMHPSQKLVPGVHGSGNHLQNQALHRPVVPQFRKSFTLPKTPRMATLSISGLGHYEASLNGQKVGDSFLSPGWTDYDMTVLYNTYDVTPLLKKGENVLGALVGNGFHHINRERYRKLVIAYGYPVMIAHLKIEYADGSSEVVVSDGSWKAAPSPITYSGIFGGEDYDASLEQKGWREPGFDDAAWSTAISGNAPRGRLVAENDYPLKELDRFEPISVTALGDSSWLYDFGQNASGIVELVVKGKPGQEIRLWPAELIHPDSTVNQSASGAPYYFSYKPLGNKTETWKPRFTYYGFRYVQVSGAVPAGERNPRGLPEIEELTFIHTRNSAPENGSFSTGHALLNQTHTLIDWAIRSNFQSVLTDCPHREKLGWLEQTHLMGQGVHFRYENYHLYRKLVSDMMDAQTDEGLVPDIAPEYVEFLGGFRDSPEWGSAAVILPYMLWKWYGDKETMREAWPMMLRYVHYLKGKSQDHILDHGLGDWFDLGPASPGVSQLTPISLTATATYYYDLKLMAEMARILGKPQKAELAQWAGEVRDAFNNEFFDPESHVYSTGSQTALSMPWCMGIVEDGHRDWVFANLVDTIHAGNKALTAGDVGFHYLVEALTRGKAGQLMFDMVNRDDVPGYGFQLKKGATALTESWAALEVVSNNHLMLGHVMEWFYAGLAGIGQSESSVAYREITIEPQPVAGVNGVKASFRSPYGLVRSEWQIRDLVFELTVEIPHNAKALVTLPPTDRNSVTIDGLVPGETASATNDEISPARLRLGSGTYIIRCDAGPPQ